MNNIALAVACLACLGRGLRVRTLALLSESTDSKRTSADMFAVLNPAVAFHCSDSGNLGEAVLDRQHRVGRPLCKVGLSVECAPEILIRKALDDTTNPFNPGDGRGYVPLHFPDSLCNKDLDEAETLLQLRKFLQERSPENGHSPVFPKDEYVLVLSRQIRRGPEPDVKMGVFHTDARGGPDFLKLYIADFQSSPNFGLSSEHASVITAACEAIFQSPDPKRHFHESGIFTFNAWWVTEGSRAFKLLNQPTFAKITHGKSLWQAYENETGPLLLNDLDVIRKLKMMFVDHEVAEEADHHEVAKGGGFLFNSALVLHRGSDQELVGCSTDVRVAAFPLSFLNGVSKPGYK